MCINCIHLGTYVPSEVNGGRQVAAGRCEKVKFLKPLKV